MSGKYETLDLIEQITRNDGSKYYEVANMINNGRAELAAEEGKIKEVRILQLNIPHSQAVMKYEKYINDHYQEPDDSIKYWQEWKRTPEADKMVEDILKENHIG